jgi:hypothetical protein
MRVPAYIHLPGDAMPAREPALPVPRLLSRLDAATLRDIGVSSGQLREHFRAERERILLREAGWLNLP